MANDLRLPKQLGDFGEQLVMFIFGRMYEYRVACVDHIGADLIATDCKNKKYAISVKSRVIPQKEGKAQSYDFDNQKKLRDFANSFDLVPAVAFVFIEPISLVSDFNIDVYIIELDKLKEFAENPDNGLGISIGKNGDYIFNNHPNHQKQIQNNEFIRFQRLVVRADTSKKAF